MTGRVWGTGLLAVLWLTASVADEIPLEAYGKLPTISSMALSPSGTRVAFRRSDDKMDVLAVHDLTDNRFLGGVDVSATNPRWITFIDDDHVILFASEAHRLFRYRRIHEFSGAFVFNVKSGEVRQLLTRSREIYPHQTGLGRIIGHSGDRKYLYMPAFLGGDDGGMPRYGILKVDLERNTDRVINKGTVNTIDWFVDDEGNPLVQAEMNDSRDIHRLYVRDGNKRELLHEYRTEQPLGLTGLTPDRRAIVLTAISDDTGFASYHAIDLGDGDAREQIFGREGVSAERPLVGLDRLVHGVEYSGFLPSYGFLDSELERRVTAIQSSVDGTAASLVSWTPDFGTLLFELSGGWNSGIYMLVSRDAAEPRFLSTSRPDIPPEAVVPTGIFEYEARDGLTIPALLTAKAEVLESGRASLVVFPHGGPESYDRFGFDWLVQYFASRGHAVLQPQFRGSSGFGGALRRAGYGEWGRKMSTDLDDGVQSLIDEGIVDPQRVCMVGISYGGYAALAAGAFSPFDYQCIASVNGVSDLPEMLSEARGRYGSNHWVVDYWQNQFGSETAERAALEAISPAGHAGAFRVPVLLLHGRDDAVVPLNQSTRMEKALKRAKKPVTLVRLDGEDHYLSCGETRIAALRAIADFVEEHL
ncbi:MAG: prolyl oligopeptidase family serine peptidase [Woeseia sp.]